MRKSIALLLLALTMLSCSEYQTALKSDDMALKYAAAEKKYDEGRYNKAIRLFEQLSSPYKGKPQAQKMFYMFAQSYYKTKQYSLAAYQFESFAASYPTSEHVEEALFLAAKCYAELSPRYSLDQIDTHRAVDKLQMFIDRYPNSQYLTEANEIAKQLREKLERKAYEIAYNYNKISDHKSASVALENFVSDYPGTPYKEKALYYRLDSAYELAINSVPSRMEERLNVAKVAYNNLMRHNPETEYKKDADAKLARIEQELIQFSKQ